MQGGWLGGEGPGVNPSVHVQALVTWLRPPSSPQVSFQHEVYPVEPAPGPSAPDKELEEQPLSRQVFIVQELEIRDRLPSSKINKFLYLYTSERMPRRTHSNMVLWAAVALAGTATCSHGCSRAHTLTWVVWERGRVMWLGPAQLKE